MDEFRLDENLKPHFKKPWRPDDPDPDPDAAGNLNEFMTVIPPDKISAKLTSNWIVKGLIPKTGIGAIYGPSGCGKTFVALEIGMAIARGVPWRDRRTKRTAVLYISPDGGGMVGNRIVAYKRRHGCGDDHSLFLAPDPIDLLGQRERGSMDGAEAVLETIARHETAYGVKFGVVVIDTISRAMPGGDENAAKDVTRFLDNLGRIAAGERVVIGIHHTPKSDATMLRGHSALHGACDFELNISDRTITVAKQRDGASGEVFGFDLEVVTVGEDEDGDPVTSCVVVEADASGRGRLTSADLVAIDTVTNMIAAHGEPLPQGTGFPSDGRYRGVNSSAVLAALRGSIFSDREPEASRKAWERLRNKLHGRGIIGVCGGIVWLPDRRLKPDTPAQSDYRDGRTHSDASGRYPNPSAGAPEDGGTRTDGRYSLIPSASVRPSGTQAPQERPPVNGASHRAKAEEGVSVTSVRAAESAAAHHPHERRH